MATGLQSADLANLPSDPISARNGIRTRMIQILSLTRKAVFVIRAQVRVAGIEPACLSAHDPKSCVSAKFHHTRKTKKPRNNRGSLHLYKCNTYPSIPSELNELSRYEHNIFMSQIYWYSFIPQNYFG